MGEIFRFQPYGDSGLLATVSDGISEGNYSRIRGLAAALRDKRIEAVTEIVPSYRSLLVVYDPLLSDYPSLEALIKASAMGASSGQAREEETVFLPVCYEPGFGFDLGEVAHHTGLNADQIVALHSGASYRIYMLGFLPGFPYLGGMDKRIAVPRRTSPRTRIPAGSVGIADMQTGVYPVDSPGGWNIIGRTPARLFDPGREEPTLLRAGQFVRFVPISAFEFDEIAEAQGKGGWLPEVRRATGERSGTGRPDRDRDGASEATG